MAMILLATVTMVPERCTTCAFRMSGCPVVGEFKKVGKNRNFWQKVGKKSRNFLPKSRNFFNGHSIHKQQENLFFQWSTNSCFSSLPNKFLGSNVKVWILDLDVVRGRKMFLVSNSRLLSYFFSCRTAPLFPSNIFWSQNFKVFELEVSKDIWYPQILSNFSRASYFQ